MAYSDKDLQIASEIAYFDLSDADIVKNSDNPTLRNLLSQSSVLPNLKDALKAAEDEARQKGIDSVKSVTVMKLKGQINMYNEIVAKDSKYGDWILKDVEDDNINSGLFGCLIETDPDNAIVAFRGSETTEATHQFEKDWLNSDVGLAGSGLTAQQNAVTSYMEKISSNSKFNHYGSYATTGHSLGGNDADHAFLTAPKDLQSRITQCVNLDGPGNSKEYLEKYAPVISQLSGKMKHYQWSLVGALLNPIPGADYESIKVTDNVHGKYDADSLIFKHDLGFVDFNNGSVIPDEMDNFARSIGQMSREGDSVPGWMVDSLIGTVNGIMNMSGAEKVTGATVLFGDFIAFAAANPAAAIAGGIAVAALVATAVIKPDFFYGTVIPFILDGATATIETVKSVVDGIVDAGKEAVEGIINAGKEVVETVTDIGKALVDGVVNIVETAIDVVKNTVSIAADVVSKIVEGVASAIKGLVEWIKGTFNSGYKYASSNPYIKVNTYKLRSYAERLTSINRRLVNLDRRLDDLYWEVGLLDLINLISADVLTGYSWRLNRCISYLNDTADDFENVETRILGQISSV